MADPPGENTPEFLYDYVRQILIRTRTQNLVR